MATSPVAEMNVDIPRAYTISKPVLSTTPEVCDRGTPEITSANQGDSPSQSRLSLLKTGHVPKLTRVQGSTPDRPTLGIIRSVSFTLGESGRVSSSLIPS